MSVEDPRRLLVQRLASSSYLNKSARLREMFLYLCERVLGESIDDIHEQEVGHKVFGRPADYDTSVDNIVRVHASMLRKRVEQYFATEGRREPLIIDIPRGNYAPVFKKRPASPPPTERPAASDAEGAPSPAVDLPVPPVQSQLDWKVWAPTGLAVFFACLAVFFAFRTRNVASANAPSFAGQPNIRQFWSQVFVPSKPTDIVLDDATLGFFQEISDHKISLAEYFDRSYLQSVKNAAAATKLDPALVDALILKRQSSYADIVLLEKIGATSSAVQGTTKIHFARDYSFRELKSDNVILLGKSRSNPWIEPFEGHLGLRWKFDKALGAYYPVDTAAPASDEQKYHIFRESGKPHEGYATIAFLPNLSGTGKVLIVSATGGSAVSAALDFLSDERSVAQLRSRLPKVNAADFPYFEALLKVESRSTLPRDTTVVFCRPLQQ